MAKAIVAPHMARRIRVLMEEKEVSVADLVKATGMRQQGINDILQGHVARPRKLLEIANRLETTQEWLLYGNASKARPAKREAPRVAEVPLISWIQAGKANLPEFDPQDVPLLAFADLGRGDFFALRVEGDSMDRISPEGSVIVVNRADTQLVTGRFYVFALKGETTYKSWHGGENAYLKPFSTNPIHDPIHFKKRDLVVVGRVCRSVLDL